MSIHTIMLDAVARQPWRNGGGLTQELLTWPPDPGGAAVSVAVNAATGGAVAGSTVADCSAGVPEWQLRVSVATIEADGPFSPFPGVRRWFVVMDGAGVRLHFSRTTETCRSGDAPLAFDGREAPRCQRLGGSSRDLNLMLRHGAGRAALRRVADGALLQTGRRWRALFCAGNAVLHTGGGARHELPQETLAWSDTEPGFGLAWRCETAAPAWWLTLDGDTTP